MIKTFRGNLIDSILSFKGTKFDEDDFMYELCDYGCDVYCKSSGMSPAYNDSYSEDYTFILYHSYEVADSENVSFLVNVFYEDLSRKIIDIEIKMLQSGVSNK